jgi:hypothetical protein
MSYSTTGVETYPINWTTARISNYKSCFECTGSKGGIPNCRLPYQVRDCNTDIIYTALSFNNLLTIGLYYLGDNFSTGQKSCFEVLGYGYPESDPLEISISSLAVGFSTCEQCNLLQQRHN